MLMKRSSRTLLSLALPILLVASALVFAADYTLTVNKDRLINALNEPQNWLLMNGDYGSTRYSKLTQINRDNVKNLRMVWAMALGGMQDVGQNGPENEVNPLIDNGFMYTSDGWGTVYKIDARNPNRAKFVWIADPGVKHEGNAPRTRGIALWEDRVIANLPDGRVIAINRDNGEIVWDKKIAAKNEFGGQEKFLDRAARRRRQGDHPERRRRRRHARLGGGARREDRQRAVALLRRAEAGRSRAARPGRTITTPGRPAAAASGRPAPTIRPPSSTSSAPATRIRSTTRSSGPATTSTRTRSSRSTSTTGKLAWHFQYTPNDSWDFDEVGVHMLYDTTIDGAEAQGRRPLRAQRLLLHARSDQRQVHQGREVRQRSELDQGHRSEDRQAGRIQPEARRAALQPRGARAARRRQEAHLPDVARRRRAPAAGVQPGQEHRLRRRHRRLLLAERRGGGVRCPKDGGIDTKASQPRQYSSDLYYGARDGVRRRQPQGGRRRRSPTSRSDRA